MDVLSVGRVSVDLYAQEANIGFDGQQTFQKSIGGSPTNVAVAAARLGLKAALATKVGKDGFGEYVRNKLSGFGVATDYVFTQPGAQTPLAFAALTPPETPTIAFYRNQAPDTT
jgi:5-dehydro-2-deoxygluconokinase